MLPRIDKPYAAVVLSDQQRESVARVVSEFVQDVCDAVGNDYAGVALARRAVHECVAYVMARLPEGVVRVDGACVRPLLQEACSEIDAVRPDSPREP